MLGGCQLTSIALQDTCRGCGTCPSRQRTAGASAGDCGTTCKCCLQSQKTATHAKPRWKAGMTQTRTDLLAQQAPGRAGHSAQAEDDPFHRPHQLLPVKLAGDLRHAATVSAPMSTAARSWKSPHGLACIPAWLLGSAAVRKQRVLLTPTIRSELPAKQVRCVRGLWASPRGRSSRMRLHHSQTGGSPGPAQIIAG